MCQSLFFNKVADLRPATLLKKRLWHRCFPAIFVKFLRTPFVQNTSERLLLEFENGKQFQVVKKYSKIICNWSFFQKDILNYLIERFEKLKVDKMFCIPDLLIKDYHRLLNYVGCKFVLALLLFCNREFGKNENCSFCTRLICFEKQHSDIFDELDNIKLKHVLSEAPEDIESAFNFFCCSQEDTVFSLNCFMARSKQNYGVISLSAENFPDFNRLGANYPMLIFNHVITIRSRIAISFLYKTLSKKFHPFRFNRDCAFLMVELIKVFLYNVF